MLGLMSVLDPPSKENWGLIWCRGASSAKQFWVVVLKSMGAGFPQGRIHFNLD